MDLTSSGVQHHEISHLLREEIMEDLYWFIRRMGGLVVLHSGQGLLVVRLRKVSEGGIYCVILLYSMLFTQYSIITQNMMYVQERNP